MGRTGRRDEHVVIVEEGLSAFDRVFRGFNVLRADVVVTVFAWLPFRDTEISEFLDVRDPSRRVFMIEGRIDPRERLRPENFLVV